jgi:hypothetical protein
MPKMAGSSTYSWWQYARWMNNIGRNMRITEPTGAELAALRTFLKLFWNPVTATGTRSWLATAYNKKAVTSTTNYVCNIDSQPTHVLVELLVVVGRDLDEIPMTDAEAGYCNTLIAATGNRRYGTGTNFGGVGGSLVTIV